MLPRHTNYRADHLPSDTTEEEKKDMTSTDNVYVTNGKENPDINALNNLYTSKKGLELPLISENNLPSSRSVDSLHSCGNESLPPGSFCDTDAALFQFDYEMLEEEGIDDNSGHSGPNATAKRRSQNKDGFLKDHAKKVQHTCPKGVIKNELILFGVDLSHLNAASQFFISAFGVLFFNMIYGYLQELIQIRIAGRCFALFLGACQFFGYAFWSYVLARLRHRMLRLRKNVKIEEAKNIGGQIYLSISTKDVEENLDVSKNETLQEMDETRVFATNSTTPGAPLGTYFALSTIRAIDLGLTNLSMKYLNYPAKTLIKSSRVIFTMVLGIIIGKKKYKKADYTMVFMLVIGLALFLHADMHNSAVFHPIGVAMLAASLTLDATVSNWSELIMKRQNLGQDDFQMKLYSFSFLIMLTAAYQSNELWSGIDFFFLSDGTYSEYMSEGMGDNQYSWSRKNKCIAVFLFSTLGIFGGSCAAAITKRFGALTMSITTTTRKAATIFFSFAMFNNDCTPEHIIGVLIFVVGLLLKGVRNHISCRPLLLWLPKAIQPRSCQNK